MTIKLHEVHGGVIAGSGDSYEIRSFVDSFRASKSVHSKSLASYIDLSRTDVIFLKESKLYLLSKAVKGTCHWVEVTTPFAIGSGRRYALGAMEYGASSEEAVLIAAKYDKHTGGKIFTLQPLLEED